MHFSLTRCLVVAGAVVAVAAAAADTACAQDATPTRRPVRPGRLGARTDASIERVVDRELGDWLLEHEVTASAGAGGGRGFDASDQLRRTTRRVHAPVSIDGAITLRYSRRLSPRRSLSCLLGIEGVFHSSDAVSESGQASNTGAAN
ncbi:MAG: hypothetical protein ACYTGX_16410, partial [Planctomycetota bacterium]